MTRSALSALLAALCLAVCAPPSEAGGWARAHHSLSTRAVAPPGSNLYHVTVENRANTPVVGPIRLVLAAPPLASIATPDGAIDGVGPYVQGAPDGTVLESGTSTSAVQILLNDIPARINAAFFAYLPDGDGDGVADAEDNCLATEAPPVGRDGCAPHDTRTRLTPPLFRQAAVLPGAPARVSVSTTLVGYGSPPQRVRLHPAPGESAPIEMRDDGVWPDARAADATYTAFLTLSNEATSAESPTRYYATATTETAALASATNALPVSRFALAPPARTAAAPTANDPDTGARVISDEALVLADPEAHPGVIDELAASLGGRVDGALPAYGIYVLQIPDTGDFDGVARALGTLRAHPDIHAAIPSYVLTPSADLSLASPANGAPGACSLRRTRAHEIAWSLPDGNGLPPIGVADSSFDLAHPNLSRFAYRILTDVFSSPEAPEPAAGIDYGRAGLDPYPSDPSDAHGTALLGALVAFTSGHPRLAPPVALAALATGTDADAVPEHRLMRALHDLAGLGVRTLLTGYSTIATGPDHARFWEAIAQRLAEHDVLIVAPSGNDARPQARYPCAAPAVLCVGGTAHPSQNGQPHARWTNLSGEQGSNFGAWVDLAAPAQGFTLPVPATPSGPQGPTRRGLDGTSLSAAVVAPAAALVRARHPTWDAQRVAAHLVATSAPLGPAPDGSPLGIGAELDFAAALSDGYELLVTVPDPGRRSFDYRIVRAGTRRNASLGELAEEPVQGTITFVATGPHGPVEQTTTPVATAQGTVAQPLTYHADARGAFFFRGTVGKTPLALHAAVTHALHLAPVAPDTLTKGIKVSVTDTPFHLPHQSAGRTVPSQIETVMVFGIAPDGTRTALPGSFDGATWTPRDTPAHSRIAILVHATVQDCLETPEPANDPLGPPFATSRMVLPQEFEPTEGMSTAHKNDHGSRQILP